MPAIVGRAMDRRKKTKKRRRKTTCRRTRSRTGLTPAVRKHADLLCLLSRVGPVQTRRILASGLGDTRLLRAVAECSHKVLSGTVRLTTLQHKRLRRHKTALRRLTKEYRTRKRHSKKDLQRQRALLMRGGFLGSLLGVVGPLIAGAVGKLTQDASTAVATMANNKDKKKTNENKNSGCPSLVGKMVLVRPSVLRRLTDGTSRDCHKKVRKPQTPKKYQKRRGRK